MNTKKVNIAGKELTLYERRAKDVLDLADFLKNSQKDGIANINIFVGVQILMASLRPNIENLKWYQIFEKRRLKRIISYEYLILSLSISELDELVSETYLLEGIDTKKKVIPEPESESAEKSQAGS